MPQINHVIFDLGKVLVDFSYAQLFPLLRKRGALIKDVEEFAARVDLAEYEMGRISAEQFLQNVNSLLSAPFESEELQQAWCNIFTPLPQMLNLAREIKAVAQTYIISNTSDLHWDHLKERFQLETLCNGCFASFEVGQMKPSAEVYRLAEKRFGFQASEAVFIDDRLENVEGAKACNWQAIHHRDFGQTRLALRNLGLPLAPL